jgi:hypothetical protein
LCDMTGFAGRREGAPKIVRRFGPPGGLLRNPVMSHMSGHLGVDRAVMRLLGRLAGRCRVGWLWQRSGGLPAHDGVNVRRGPVVRGCEARQSEQNAQSAASRWARRSMAIPQQAPGRPRSANDLGGQRRSPDGATETPGRGQHRPGGLRAPGHRQQHRVPAYDSYVCKSLGGRGANRSTTSTPRGFEVSRSPETGYLYGCWWYPTPPASERCTQRKPRKPPVGAVRYRANQSGG